MSEASIHHDQVRLPVLALAFHTRKSQSATDGFPSQPHKAELTVENRRQHSIDENHKDRSALGAVMDQACRETAPFTPDPKHFFSPV